MGVIERRQMILEYLSDYRQATYRELAERFGVSKNTIVKDIEELICSAPIYTVAGKYGGIRAMDGWYLSRRYLHDDQEELLRRLLPGLQLEDQATMVRILTAFVKPKVKEADR